MTSKRRYHLAVLTLAALVLLMGAGPAAAQKKPNIVMLMTDDTGWNDCIASGRSVFPNRTFSGRCSWDPV